MLIFFGPIFLIASPLVYILNSICICIKSSTCISWGISFYLCFLIILLIVSNGYGDDRQSHLEPFPFTQPSPKQGDDDAELRRQLNHMGGGKRTSYF